MADPARKRASYADLESLPPNVVGEILFGVLHVLPRPRLRHASASSRLGARLGGSFDEGSGGSGWVLLDEPELHLEEDVLVPDIAGWRRERLPELPDAPFLSLAPDWVCEVISPSTSSLDRTDKRAIYFRENVRHLWLVDPSDRLLEVQRWSEGGYVTIGAWRGDVSVHAEPFESLAIPLGALWAG
jgi:Uma2 family endonuclease